MYPDDLKVAAVVVALPSAVQLHVQIELYEQVSIRWNFDAGSQSATLQLADMSKGLEDTGPQPMDDQFGSVTKGKGKDGKGKGKKGGVRTCYKCGKPG